MQEEEDNPSSNSKKKRDFNDNTEDLYDLSKFLFLYITIYIINIIF
jgi:hypothetical protein